ncbi:sensor histidine kinase [Paenibacillus woosongensis]|uniref:histidine kinase n=1 Tax=Paenibacillus woosongensis TaxID=307580 RepID=A0AA95L139_9BACL|nr:sensor histidine kinase [Paenibacillus woosongensis]WHX49269.1 sensor histidine kinase [Paenibacillus woosongensis]
MSRKAFEFLPQKLGFFPYVWLIYIAMPIFNLRSYSGFMLLGGCLMITLFVISYRQLYFVTGRAFNGWLALQMAIILAMSILYSPYNLYMGFFTANFIGWYTDRKKFRISMAAFLLMQALSIMLNLPRFKGTDLLLLLPFLVIMIASPFGIRSLNTRQQLEKELDQANEQIEALIKREERLRIARDLHDTLGHTLSLITLKSQLVERLAPLDPQRAQEEAREIQRTSRAALRQVRELVSDMRAAMISEELSEAEEILRIAGIKLEVSGDSSSIQDIPDLTQNIVSLCIREAVTNAVKHSRAKCCRIAIERSEASVQLAVEDDGIGLDHSAAAELTTGNGLKGMAERLSLINGTLTISPGQSGGTLLRIVVPIITKDGKEDGQHDLHYHR